MLNKKSVTLVEMTDEFGCSIPALVAEVEIIGNNTDGVRSIVKFKAPDGDLFPDDIMTLESDGSGGMTTSIAGLILPTADPLIAGAWWDNAGTLTKSAGP